MAGVSYASGRPKSRGRKLSGQAVTRFALINTRATRARNTINKPKSDIDEFDLINAVGMLNSIIDICEESTEEHE